MLATIFCAFCAWTILFLSIGSLFFTLIQGKKHLQKLHNIPCSGCDFFTNDYRLKCTVNPMKACSEEAINCNDFEPKTKDCNASQKGRSKFY
ncbi:MAG: hypothetical protein ACFB02_19640 [Mastigocoleus sp.]